MSETGGIVVTGASTGIGHACAVALAERGFRIFGGVRNDRAAADLERAGAGRILPIRLDVTSDEEIAAAVDLVAEDLAGAPLFGLFNNAGIVVGGPLEFVRPEDLRRQLDVNVLGQVAVTRAFLPMLRESRGRIVVTGSVSGIFTTPMLAPYCMSKHAMEAMADALRLELEPFGIRVSLLQPGAVATPIWEKSTRDTEAAMADAPEELEALYGSQLEEIRRLAALSEKGAAPVRVVVDAVVHAFTAKRPRPRYLMAGNARAQRLMAALPTSWRDALVRRLLGR